MKALRFAAPAVVLVAFAGCGDPAAPDLIDDSALTRDIAVTSGDAVAQAIETMNGNEAEAGGSAEMASVAEPAATAAIEVSRTINCFDAAGAPVNDCTPFSSVRMVVAAAAVTGSSSGSRPNGNGGVVNWTAAVHRAATDTTRRTFNVGAGTEASRSHVGTGTAKDTVTATEGNITRLLAVTAVDSVKNITFNLPRGSNPYPVSGSFVRTATVHAEVSNANQSASRDATVRVQVTFPADPQGNVALTVNGVNCQLNLVTHAVTACQ